MIPSRATRLLILGTVGAIFLIPIVAMVEFTLRGGLGGGYDPARWISVFTGELGPAYRPIWTGLGNSVLLAVVTVGIVLFVLLPTMVLVHLRFPRLRRLFEFVVLLPISIPAIVLVVGLAPVYSTVARLFGSGAWTLGFAYGILVLPFAYRAIQSNMDALDLVTLAEAARSLGASWGAVLVRVLLPNLRRGVLAASVIAVAVVLGEFTIASLLNRQNLQTALVLVQKNDPFVAVIFALLALLFAFLLLLLIGRVGATRTPRRIP